jgi:sulfhydrogenase subunit beta (sulfur reductase)
MDIERYVILKSSIDAILKSLLALGNDVVAPVQKEDVVYFEKIDEKSKIAEDFVQTKLSSKSVAFPRLEKLFGFKKTKESVTVEDIEPEKFRETILWGVKPCDSSGFLALNSIFNWDYKDKIYNSRYEKLTIITFSCHTSDEYCFCTSVGGNPGGTAGSDILFTKAEGENYIAEIVSEKGKKIRDLFSEYFLPDNPNLEKDKFLPKIDRIFDKEVIQERLQKFFESEIWKKQSERCLGCGACAFVCPACGCFDIQDETTGNSGNRIRCWDSCGFSQFTIHASGHNPRATQSQRWRQRLLHKFSIMPERLNIIGCTGCGRCSRACPVDMNLLEHLTSIMKLQDD